MLRKTALIILDILIIILLLCFIFSLLYFINGSAEMFPTGEQQEKARIGAAFLAFLTAIPLAACVFLRIKGHKKK